MKKPLSPAARDHIRRLVRLHREMREGNAAEAKARYDAEQAVINAEREQHSKAGAERLGVIETLGEIPERLKPYLAAWHAAGCPERDGWEELWRSQTDCPNMRPSGMCGKIGCANQQRGHRVPCQYLCRMATAQCPTGRFGESPDWNKLAGMIEAIAERVSSESGPPTDSGQGRN
jgi:hypothetical protein